MDCRWFTFIDGVISGPFGKEEVRHLATLKTSSGAVKISKEGEFVWKTISEFPEFNSGIQVVPAASEIPVLRPPAPEKKEYPDAVEQIWINDRVKLSCPHCYQHYTVEFHLCQGQTITCQECGDKFMLNLLPEIIAEATLATGKNRSDDVLCPHCGKAIPEEYFRNSGSAVIPPDTVRAGQRAINSTPAAAMSGSPEQFD